LFFLRSWYVRDILRKSALPLDLEGRWKMLDAGSGFGQYDRFILENFENVQIKALDVKVDYLRDSKIYFEKEIQRGRIKFEQKDLLQFHEPEEYNFAICIDVLE